MQKIFLSHSSRDKKFVNLLAKKIQENGLDVWLDEAEISIGESLIQKISEGLYYSEFVIAVISKHSVNSEWVKKELYLAMHKEIAGKKITVLPIKIDNCDVPFFLSDKLYADFRDIRNFESEFQKILNSLSKHMNIEPTQNNNLDQVEASFLKKDVNESSFGEIPLGSIMHTKDVEDYYFAKELRSDRLYSIIDLFLFITSFVLAIVLRNHLPKLSYYLYGLCILIFAAGVSLYFSYMTGLFVLNHDKRIVYEIERNGYFAIPFGPSWINLVKKERRNFLFVLHLFFKAIYVTLFWVAAVYAVFAILLG